MIIASRISCCTLSPGSAGVSVKAVSAGVTARWASITRCHFPRRSRFIGNSLIGGWVFGEWVGWHDSVLGVIALLIILAGALTIYVVGRKRIPGQDPWGLRNITSGFIFAVAAGTYLMSLSLNGLVNGFVLTQLNVVVATLLGVIVLKEANLKQLVPKAIGLAILIGGAVMMVHI